ncbi:MAG: fumarylacetoacetate hydrolase family protein [Pirellulaceae bacterium]
MKIVRFRNPRNDNIYLGRLEQDRCLATGLFGENLPDAMVDMINQLQQFISNAPVMESFAQDQVVLLPPVDRPQKIICVGQNYADHAREMGSKVPEQPVIFNKFPTALAGPDSSIRLPAISASVDYEAELVVVIGRRCKHVSVDQAMQHVLGYCCGHDVSARDWQKGRPGGQWLLGKTFDEFAPIGPWLVLADDIDPNCLEISLQLNGQTMQQSNTENLIFKIDFLISHLSKFCTLLPGDLLFTGTPAGVGAGRTPPVFLQAGDETIVEIEGLGQLRNTFIADADAS